MKCSVIGLGPMDLRYIQAIKEPNLEICGLCDKEESKIKEAKKKFDFAKELFFTDSYLLMERVKPEAVIIATNSDSRKDIVEMASKYAKYILCEKPMASSVKDCETILKICREKNIKMAVNHPQRFSQRYITLKKIVNEERFGGLENMAFVCANVGFAMIGSHLVEIARFITDENICYVNAIFEDSNHQNPRGDRFNDPVGVLIGRTANNKKIVVVIGNDSGYEIKMIITCRYGIIEVDLIRGLLRMSYRRKENGIYPPTRYGLESIEEEMAIPSESVVELTKSMVMGLINWEENVRSSAEDALYAVKTLVAGYFSSENGGIVTELNNDFYEKVFS